VFFRPYASPIGLRTNREKKRQEAAVNQYYKVDANEGFYEDDGEFEYHKEEVEFDEVDTPHNQVDQLLEANMDIEV
jgi:hypothetical protein